MQDATPTVEIVEGGSMMARVLEAAFASAIYSIIGVVLNHTAGWGYTAMFWWTDRYREVVVPNFDQLGSLSYYSLRFIEQAIIFAIPAFLFVSGFFIAAATGRSKNTIGWKLVWTRVLSLLIPYLVWTAAFFAVDLAQGVTYSPNGYLQRLVFGRTTSGYYYVPLLCQYYLLSPLIVPLARTRWRPLLIGAGLIQGIILLARYGSILNIQIAGLEQLTAWSVSWFFPGHLLWFTLGVVVGFHVGMFNAWLSKVKWAAVAIWAVTLVLGIIEWETLFGLSGQEWIATSRTLLDEIYSGAFIFSFLAFTNLTIPFSEQLGALGSKSYGVFLAHTMFLTLGARAVYHLLPRLLALEVIFQPYLILLGLGGPLILMAIAIRSPLRPYYKYLFG